MFPLSLKGQLNGVDGWFDPTCVREITAKQQQQLLKQKPALQPEGQTSSRAHNHTSVRTVKQRGATDAAAALKRAAAAAAGVGRSARQEVPPADVLRALTPDMPPMPAHLSTMSLDLSNLVSFNNLSAADLASAVGEWNEPQTEAKAGRKPPLATNNLLKDTDGCGSPLLLLTCALLMTSSRSEGRHRS